MSTYPTDIQLRPRGIVLALYPHPNPSYMSEVWRAPDSSGSPDTSNDEIVAVLGPGNRVYTDIIGGAGPYHYRFRHIRPKATASGYTDWVAAYPTYLPSVLPQIPSGYEVKKTYTIGPSAFGATPNVSLRPSTTMSTETFTTDLSNLLRPDSRIIEIRSTARRRNAADAITVDIYHPPFTTGFPPVLTEFTPETLTHSNDSSFTTETYTPSSPLKVVSGESRRVVVSLYADSSVADAEFWRIEVDALEANR